MTDQPNMIITEPEGGDPIKIGARNNSQDLQRIQQMHDTAVELGAVCPGEQDEPPMMDTEKAVVFYGGEVKALGDGKVGGYLVRFTSEDDTDLTGDYFAKDTDYGDAETSPVYYHHGLDAKMGKRVLGKGTQKKDDVGVWIEAQLQMRDEYEKAVYEMAQAGKLGWSSGTAGHLVERQGSKITRWPLGLDASLTPTPAEPRNSAIPLKSLISAPEASQGEAAAVQNPIEKDTQNEVNTMDENEVKTLAQKIEDEVATRLETKFSEMLINHKAPAMNKTGLGDTETKAMAAFIRKGDLGGVKAFPYIDVTGSQEITFKASNATDMNETTAADGGDAVPTGHAANIAARRDESALYAKLRLTPIPGTGKTVDVTYDNEADGEFVATNEAAQFDEDAPALAKKSFTLAKYSKRVLISDELMTDTDTNLLSFVEGFVGRGAAKTENSLLLTEAAASGTALKTFAAAAAYATGELEDIMFNSDLANYLDGGNISWITSPANYALIAKLGSTSLRWYGAQGQGNISPAPQILGYPVAFSGKVATAAASAKSIYFGDWSHMGRRAVPGFTMLRDPYTLADYGQVRLLYYFRVAYGVLIAEALGYGVHPTA